MSRFGNEFNPCGRDRDRFETEGAFEARCSKDRIINEENQELERRRREEERENRETNT